MDGTEEGSLNSPHSTCRTRLRVLGFGFRASYFELWVLGLVLWYSLTKMLEADVVSKTTSTCITDQELKTTMKHMSETAGQGAHQCQEENIVVAVATAAATVAIVSGVVVLVVGVGVGVVVVVVVAGGVVVAVVVVDVDACVEKQGFRVRL